jgi:dGTPase
VSGRFGPPGNTWIGAMITAVLEESLRVGEVRMDAGTLAVMNELRDFMFDRVYLSAAQRTRSAEAIDLLRRLMDWYLLHPEQLPEGYREARADRVTQAADHVAGMTDRFAQRTHERLFGTPGITGEGAW